MPAQKKQTMAPGAKKSTGKKSASTPLPVAKTTSKVVAAKAVVKASAPKRSTAVVEPKTKASAFGKGTKKTVKSTTKSAIRLLQIAGKGGATDPAFEAYQPEPSAWQFSAILNALFAAQRDSALQKSELWGLMTVNFTPRTGMSGQDLLKVIESNPGFDLYYASAQPELEAVYHNPWRPPEVTHLGFVDLSRRFLKSAGLSDAPVDSLSDSALFATGHLMVATPLIWEKYTVFVAGVFAKAQKNLSPADHAMLFKETPVAGRMTYLSLIVARLLSLFLMLRDSTFRAYKITLPEQEKSLNNHLLFLRDMKDIGLARKSKWHLAAWLSYRGLYLAHVMGKAWILKHINGITPSNLHTAMPVPQVVNSYNRAIQATPHV